MELLELIVTETTSSHILFKISVEESNFWGVKKIKEYNCQRPLKCIQSKFISNGESIYLKWLYLDNSINTILSTNEKYYIK